MKDLLTRLLLWFLFETDEVVIEPLEALGADLTASDLEVDVWIAAVFDAFPPFPQLSLFSSAPTMGYWWKF